MFIEAIPVPVDKSVAIELFTADKAVGVNPSAELAVAVSVPVTVALARVANPLVDNVVNAPVLFVVPPIGTLFIALFPPPVAINAVNEPVDLFPTSPPPIGVLVIELVPPPVAIKLVNEPVPALLPPIFTLFILPSVAPVQSSCEKLPVPGVLLPIVTPLKTPPSTIETGMTKLVVPTEVILPSPPICSEVFPLVNLKLA